MGTSGIPVYAMPRMTAFLRDNGPWSQLVELENIALQPLVDGEAVDLGAVRVVPFLVPHRDEFSETVGYRIEGPERTAVFIPDIDKWDRWDTPLADVVRGADLVFLDATFFADGELGRDMSSIPHPFVTESMDLLRDLPAEERGKVHFIHMNHTNPLLRTGTPERETVLGAGFRVAEEGLRLGL
jgi:pyrroloquinoline quinone biosynthesis protein B